MSLQIPTVIVGIRTRAIACFQGPAPRAQRRGDPLPLPIARVAIRIKAAHDLGAVMLEVTLNLVLLPHAENVAHFRSAREIAAKSVS